VTNYRQERPDFRSELTDLCPFVRKQDARAVFHPTTTHNTPSTMPDEPPPSPPQPPAPGTPAATPEEQSRINQEQAAAITRAEDIALVALSGAYAATLAEFGLPASFSTAIITGATEARELQTQSQAADIAQSGDTDSVTLLRNQLTTFMQQAQGWARAVHYFTNPARLALYHVGEDLDANLPTLKQFSLDIRSAGTADQLAGFTPAYLTAYNATRGALFGPGTSGSEPEPDDEAVDVRAVFAAKVEALTRASMRILFLADGIWPHGQPGSAGPRHAFELPPDRPYAPPTPEAPVPGENPSMG